MPERTDGQHPDPAVGHPVDLQRVLHIGVHLAGRLAALHDRGTVHGGVSPAAVDIADDGTVSLLAHDPDVSVDARYAAVEVLDGGPVTVRSDLAELGATLAAFALGRPPTRTPSRAIDIYGHGVDAGLCNVIDAAAAPDPLDRYDSADELIGELHVVESRHGWPATVVPVGAVAASTGGLTSDHPGPTRSRGDRWFARRTATPGRARPRHITTVWSAAAVMLLVGIGFDGDVGTDETTADVAVPIPTSVVALDAPTATDALTATTATMSGKSSSTSAPATTVPSTTTVVTVGSTAAPAIDSTQGVGDVPTTPPVPVPTTRSPPPTTRPPATTRPPTPVTTGQPPTTPGSTTVPTPGTSAPADITTTTAPPVTSPPTAPTTRPPATTRPAPPSTTRPAPTTTTTPPTTQPTPTTTTIAAKPPRVGQINVWKNPDDSGTWAFGAPDADRCAIAHWELTGPVSASTTKDPRNSPGATNGCFDGALKFNTYFSNVALAPGDYTIQLTVTNLKSGLSGSNSAAFTVP